MRWKFRRRELLMITGAHGFLGTHLVLASEEGHWDLFTPPSGALDVRNERRVFDDITTWKPKAIVHLAYRPDDRSVIVDGSRNVAVAAAAIGARLIHLSTDVVFAGRPLPYQEHDVTDATQDYGRWKAEAEVAVQQAHPAAVLVRTSLLYGTHHRSTGQRDVADALAGRTHPTFFTDEHRCPAHADDVAAAILLLATRPDITGPLHVAGPEVVSRAELASAFATWLGGDPSSLHTAPRGDQFAERPGNVVLDVSKAADLGIRCRTLADGLAGIRRPTG